ncbi:hypothetical protein LZ30DRAFT_736796 [Colletotrichum cereale]|nr:hypothetical protein LZ30DRAFT_736796 [Colletotrichum cereale]
MCRRLGSVGTVVCLSLTEVLPHHPSLSTKRLLPWKPPTHTDQLCAACLRPPVRFFSPEGPHCSRHRHTHPLRAPSPLLPQQCCPAVADRTPKVDWGPHLHVLTFSYTTAGERAAGAVPKWGEANLGEESIFCPSKLSKPSIRACGA